MTEDRTFPFKAVLFDWWSDYRDSFFFVFIPMAAGMCLILLQRDLPWAPAALWAFACLSAGSLVGFLFGVPKLSPDQLPGTEGNRSPSARRPRYVPNTNLDNISDWLTKAIVGVGLVELRQVPGFLKSLAEFAAGGPSASSEAQSTATALIVLFASLGFIGGYVNTRLHFAAAFRRAESDLDQENSSFATENRDSNTSGRSAPEIPAAAEPHEGSPALEVGAPDRKPSGRNS